jgi:hypothetical protein
MNIKKLILYILFFPLMLSAQKTFEFPAQMDKMTGVNKHFYIDKVIDARNGRFDNYIGRVQTGAFNTKNDAFLNSPLADELTKVVHKLLPNGTDSIELILKVNRLKIWEQTFVATEEAYAFGDFELLIKKDTAYYVVDSYNSLVRKRSGWDVTRSHIKNIVNILETALDTFQTRQNWLNPTTGLPPLAAADILRKNTPNILVDSVRKKGVYRHFGEFLSNKPSLPMVYREKNGKKIVLTLDEVGHKKELDSTSDAWGFCDGKDIFVCQQGDFFPLQSEKDAFIFRGYDPKKQAKRQQTGAVLFGLIGAAVASATRGDLEAMMVNMDSGECQPQK